MSTSEKGGLEFESRTMDLVGGEGVAGQAYRRENELGFPLKVPKNLGLTQPLASEDICLLCRTPVVRA